MIWKSFWHILADFTWHLRSNVAISEKNLGYVIQTADSWSVSGLH